MPQTQTTGQPAPTIEVTDCEVIARIGSKSNPSRKPYETYINRYTAKCRCDCQGFRTHGHCSHQEALTALALEQNLIIKVRRGHRAEAKAAIESFDPYSAYLARDLKVRPSELSQADLDEIDAQAMETAESDREIEGYEKRQAEIQGSDVEFVGAWL